VRTLIVTEFVSLDGVMEAPGGEPGYPHTGWVEPYFTPELGAYKEQEQLAAGVLLLGRVTYDSFYGAWPERDGPMADKINTMPKLVASRSIGSSEWAATTVTPDLVGAVTGLKAGDGDPILVVGSRGVAHTLLAAGLVDEVRLQVMPIVLGSGFRFWPESPDTLPLELHTVQGIPGGVVLQSYRVPARG
jgi:dihydrofolate reductase